MSELTKALVEFDNFIHVSPPSMLLYFFKSLSAGLSRGTHISAWIPLKNTTKDLHSDYMLTLVEGERLRFPEEAIELNGLLRDPNDFLVNVRQLVREGMNAGPERLAPENLTYPPGRFRQRGRKVLDRDTRSVTDPLCRANSRLFGPLWRFCQSFIVSHC